MQNLPTEIVVADFVLKHMKPTRDMALVQYDVFTTDEKNMRFWLCGEKIKSVDEVFDALNKAYENNNQYMYEILQNNKIIGEIGFSSVVEKNKYVWVGYWLVPGVRGRRLINTLFPTIERLAFDDLAMNKIMLGIDVDNHASRKIAEKNGYTLDGIMRDERMWPDGSFHDECEYSKLKSEWAKDNKNA